MAGTVLDARAIISGEDRTGAMWASFARNTASASKAAAAFNRIGAATSLSNVVASRRMVDGMSEGVAASLRMVAGLSKAGAEAEAVASKIGLIGDAALATERRISLLSRSMQGARAIWQSAAPFAAGALGFGAWRATKGAIKGGADLQSELVRLKVAGIPDSEIASAENLSYRLAARYPNLTPAEILQAYKETRSVLMKPGETAGVMDTIAAARSSMKGLGMGQEDTDALAFAVKAAEVTGRAQDPKRFESYIDSFLRAKQVAGSTLTPEQMFHFAQQMKSASATLSDRFINTVGLAMTQEMQGGQAGVGAQRFTKQMIGGLQAGQQHSAVKEMLKLGMIHERDVEYSRRGEIKGLRPGHHPKQWRTAISDPDIYVNDVLMPLLKAHGYTSLEDQAAEISRIFTDVRGANFVTKLVQQSESFKADTAKYGAAQGVRGAQTSMRDDPVAALNSLTTSFQTLGATLTSPVMKDAAHYLSSFASAIGSFSAQLEAFGKAHPEMAKMISGASITGGLGVAAAGTLGFFKGVFGLSTAATALNQSAAALDAAAARLGGAGAVLPRGKSPSAGLGIFGLTTLSVSSLFIAAQTANLVAQLKKGEEPEEWKSVRSFNEWAHEKAPWLFGPDDSVDASAPSSGHGKKSLPDVSRNEPLHVDGNVEGSARVTLDLTPRAAEAFATAKEVSINLKGQLQHGGDTGISMPEARPYRKGNQ